MRLCLNADLICRRVATQGDARYVFGNPVTGRYFRAAPRLFALARALDPRHTVAAALAALQPAATAAERDALLDGLAGMMMAGLLRRADGPSSAAAVAPVFSGILRRIAYTRLPLFRLGPLLPAAAIVFGWLFSLPGAALLLALLGFALLTLLDQAAETAAQMARLANLGAADVATGYAIYFGAKLLHELGHALAAARMARQEGQPAGPFRCGLSFMFLLPAPYVDVSSAWLLASRWRRAAVGLGGIAMDLLLASLAALAWMQLGTGWMADRLFDLMLLCGASSLLFNLNPLLRLDGYYVLSDVLDIHDLGPRGMAGLRRLLLRPFGLAQDGPVEPVFLLHAVLALVYRTITLLGIAWLAAGVSGWLALAVAAVIVVLFVALPTRRMAPGLAMAMRMAPRRVAFAALVPLVVLVVAATLPVPAHVVAEGIAWHEGMVMVFAPADGILRHVAAPGPVTDAVMRLENPEALRTIAQLQAEAAGLAIEARRARAEAAERIDLLAERQRAVAGQIASLQAEIGTWTVSPQAGAQWEPLRAEWLHGAWLRRDDARPLGVAIAPGGMVLRCVLDQWDGPAAIAAMRDGAAVVVRRRGDAPAAFSASLLGGGEAREELPSAALAMGFGGPIPAHVDANGSARAIERVFEIRLLPAADADLSALRHGARVEARITLPAAPLLSQAWWRFRQMLQRRLAA